MFEAFGNGIGSLAALGLAGLLTLFAGLFLGYRARGTGPGDAPEKEPRLKPTYGHEPPVFIPEDVVADPDDLQGEIDAILKEDVAQELGDEITDPRKPEQLIDDLRAADAKRAARLEEYFRKSTSGE